MKGEEGDVLEVRLDVLSSLGEICKPLVTPAEALLLPRPQGISI